MDISCGVAVTASHVYILLYWGPLVSPLLQTNAVNGLCPTFAEPHLYRTSFRAPALYSYGMSLAKAVAVAVETPRSIQLPDSDLAHSFALIGIDSCIAASPSSTATQTTTAMSSALPPRQPSCG